MIRHFAAVAASAALAIGLQFAVNAAATPHEPLSPDSTAVNGTRQSLAPHQFNIKPLPALPPSGLHPHAAEGLLRRYSGAAIDALNYHYDTYPTGWNRSETDLTPATVASGSFGKLATLKVDGNVFAQPLMVSDFRMPDGAVRNVLVIATGHNTVYAYDAQSYSILWQVNLGRPQSSDDVGCSDIEPEYGISSTPVIIRRSQGSATVYLVAATEPAHFSFHTQLHALDLGTGRDVVSPGEIAPSAPLKTGGHIHFDPQNQWNRSSLVYANGSIYFGIGSHCDSNPKNVSGWILRYDPADLNLIGKFNTIEAAADNELAGIWMSGYAVAVDAEGDIVAVTGNGKYNPRVKDWGQSVLSLSADLRKVNTHFTPAAYRTLNEDDEDFGAGGAMVIPAQPGQAAPEMAVAAGKEGMVFVLNAAHLGGLHAGDRGALQKLALSPCFCGPAFYVGSDGPVLFYQGTDDTLRAFGVTTGAHPRLTQIAAGTSSGGFGGSFPIVSSNGGAANTAVVWLIRRASTMQLEAYNAATLGAPIFAANAGIWSNGSRGYLTPLIANGRVYVPAYRTVTVFGLTD